MSIDTDERAHRAPLLEQVVTTAGVIASGSALLCLLAVAVGGVALANLIWLWLATMALASLMSPWIFRRIRPLFWH